MVLVNGGRSSERLTPDEGIKRYLALANADMDLPLAQKPRKQHKTRPAIFTGLKMYTNSGHQNVLDCGGEVTFEIEAENFDDVRNATCGVALHNERGHRIAFFHTDYHSNVRFDGSRRAKFTCRVPSLPLVPGSYYIELVMADERQIIEQVERADRLDIVFKDILGTGMMPRKNQGYVVLPSEWNREVA